MTVRNPLVIVAGEVKELPTGDTINGSSVSITGLATIDFGSTFPGSNETSVVVTGISNILSTSRVRPFFMTGSTSDHTENDHKYASLLIDLTVNPISVGSGFTLNATSTQKFNGTFLVHYICII